MISRHPRFPEVWHLVRAAGWGPFRSRLHFRLPDGSERVWESRAHRKHRAAGTPGGAGRLLWSPGELGWWIAVLFTAGSLLFALASLAGLGPDLLPGLSGRETRVNRTYFAGSLFFTVAAYLQLLQCINADGKVEPGLPFRWFAWWPGRLGWLASFIQLIGTLLFNLNTLDALSPLPGWLRQDLLVWTPDMVGSLCFMAASQLAVHEVFHGWWSWRPGNVSWWIVAVNWLGSVAFLVAAGAALVRPAVDTPLSMWWSICMTFAGAVCFLAGSVLLLPEAAAADEIT